MILTVTLNAALDVTYRVPRLEPHHSHRVEQLHRRAGGKGLNVARVLHQLGHDVLATGFVAGSTGDAIRADLDAAGIRHALVELAPVDRATKGDREAGESRSTLTVVDAVTEDATVFNEPGPGIGQESWSRFLTRFDALAADADVVVLSGSLPPGLDQEAYAELCSRVDAPCLVDTSGPALVAAARAGAAVLTPNRAELREATGHDDILSGAVSLRDAGAGALLVSLGADGLVAVTAVGIWRAAAPERLRGNPTGAGDAVTAALAGTWNRPWPEVIREAVAWSAAAVPMALAGEIDPGTLNRVRGAVRVERVGEDPCP